MDIEKVIFTTKYLKNKETKHVFNELENELFIIIIKIESISDQLGKES